MLHTCVYYFMLHTCVSYFMLHTCVCTILYILYFELGNDQIVLKNLFILDETQKHLTYLDSIELSGNKSFSLLTYYDLKYSLFHF